MTFIVASDAGVSIVCRVASASAPIRLPRYGKFEMISMMDPKMVSGKASMKESRRILKKLILLIFSPRVIIGPSILS